MRDVALPKCRIEQLPQVVLPIKQAKRQSTAGEVILKKPELELRGVWEQVPGVQALHTTEQEELPIGRPKAGRCSGGRPRPADGQLPSGIPRKIRPKSGAGGPLRGIPTYLRNFLATARIFRGNYRCSIYRAR